MRPTKQMRKQLERDNRQYLETLQRIEVPPGVPVPPGQIEVWRSRRFLVQVFDDGHHGLVRLSVCRTSHNGESWDDGITWDDLQRLKRECGRGECDAVEVFPRDYDVVDVANMRHLFIFTDMLLPYAWRKP